MKILSWSTLTDNEKKQYLMRSSVQNTKTIVEGVSSIIEAVRVKGDTALKEYTLRFDKVALESIAVQADEIKAAERKVSQQSMSVIYRAIDRLMNMNKAQLPIAWRYECKEGVVYQREPRAIRNVGLYVPGGTAPLVSTVMMLAVPARVAGCKRIVMCSPVQKDGEIDPYVLLTALACDVNEIYKIGGAQAIAAMAYGTQTIAKVDKIFGPGNQWVTQAKMQCSQNNTGVSIDIPAGPSELLVIADESADVSFVAADVLSQAEHDVASQLILITFSQALAKKMQQEIDNQLQTLSRRSIAEAALKNSVIIIADNMFEAIKISNDYAPEHLSLQVDEPNQYVSLIENAGTVFLGKQSAESLGDYITGANHVLPTSGYARSISGLSVNDFIKYVGFQTISQEALENIGPTAVALAAMEGLQAHARAVQIRLGEKC